jgi:hypothetical protein
MSSQGPRFGGRGARDEVRLHSDRGWAHGPRGAGGGRPRRGARARLRLDGGAPRRPRPLLALAAGGARGLRGAHVPDAPRHRRRGAAVLRPGARGGGRGHGGRAVGRPVRVRGRDRVPAGRVRPLPHAAREARGAVRGGARAYPRPVDPGLGHPSGTALSAPECAPRAEAHPAAAPSHLDRRLGRADDPPRGAAGRRVGARPHGPPPKAARREGPTPTPRPSSSPSAISW